MLSGDAAINVKITYKASFINALLNSFTMKIYAPAAVVITAAIDPYRSRGGMGIFSAIFVLSSLSRACLRSADKAVASAVVEEFFLALESREPARIKAAAPQMEDKLGMFEQFLGTLSRGFGWSVVETQGQKKFALVIVEIILPDEEEEAETVRLGVPVRYRRGRWKILSEITVTQNIGILPLSDS